MYRRQATKPSERRVGNREAGDKCARPTINHTDMEIQTARHLCFCLYSRSLMSSLLATGTEHAKQVRGYFCKQRRDAKTMDEWAAYPNVTETDGVMARRSK